jgi:hypothetical protein
MRLAERRGAKISGTYGSVDVRIVARIANVNRKITSMKFDIFVAGDTFDGNVPGRNAKVQTGVLGNVNGNAHVIHWAASETELRGQGHDAEAMLNLAKVIRVPSGDIHGDFALVGADDANVA